jgi:hypothetical protein
VLRLLNDDWNKQEHLHKAECRYNRSNGFVGKEFWSLQYYKKVFFCPVFPNNKKSIVVIESSQASPGRPSGNISIKMKTDLQKWWNDSDKGKTINSETEKTVPLPLRPQKNLNHTGSGSISDLRGERLATNSLGHAMTQPLEN